MEIKENVLLRDFTTLKVGGKAKYFVSVRNEEEIKQALDFAQNKNLQIFILGGGSNVLISDDGFDGLVIHPTQEGMEIISENEEYSDIKFYAGENWDKAVAFSVKNNLWGIENLSHIPGNCGAVVVQNVGAYGQEISQVLEYAGVFDLHTGEVRKFSAKDCEFTYRHSIFNSEQKDRFIILSVILRLSKKANSNLSYGDVKKYFQEKEISNPNLEQIREAIIEIRDKKFPFPRNAINGSAGSFFRGPVISSEKLNEIKEKIKEEFGESASEKIEKMKDRLQVSQGYKTPTAYLMELVGLKGLQIGGAKINETQPAIVLNATGLATSDDILNLKDEVLQKIKERFGVELEIEPEMIGFK